MSKWNGHIHALSLEIQLLIAFLTLLHLYDTIHSSSLDLYALFNMLKNHVHDLAFLYLIPNVSINILLFESCIGALKSVPPSVHLNMCHQQQ